jgi:hypothetical protein
MEVEILPEPSDEERRAILAALEPDPCVSNLRKPWSDEEEQP